MRRGIDDAAANGMGTSERDEAMSFAIRRTPRKSPKIEPKKTMTDQEINEAVAEMVGWRIAPGDSLVTDPKGFQTLRACVPDFVNRWDLLRDAVGEERFLKLKGFTRQQCEQLLREAGKWREA